jgi:AAA domain
MNEQVTVAHRIRFLALGYSLSEFRRLKVFEPQTILRIVSERISKVAAEVSVPTPAESQVPPAQGIAFMITGAVKAALIKRGYPPNAISQMTPQEAHDILASGAPSMQPPVETAAEVPSTKGVPFMVTNAQKAELAKRGYAQEAIRQMTPQTVHEILAQPADIKSEQPTRFDRVPYKPETPANQSRGTDQFIRTAANAQWAEGMITGRELCSMHFTPLKYIVPRMIPEGLTILAGRPKIGKSWLVLLLGIVLSNGVEALGLDYGMTPPLKGGVLYLGLEDGKRRLQRRMTKLIGSALPENWPEELYLKTEWRRFDQGGLDDIRSWHKSIKDRSGNPILVVVDTLAKVRAPGTSKHSPYQNDHDALAGLQKLAEELGIAVVVNHHDRKMDADDVFDTVSGTLGLTGAVDTILVLTKRAGATTLHVRGRDIEEEVSLAMRFSKADCRWSVTGTVEAQQEAYRSQERGRVLDALEALRAPMLTKEIMLASATTNRNAMDLLLFKMVRDGEVSRVGRARICSGLVAR